MELRGDARDGDQLARGVVVGAAVECAVELQIDEAGAFSRLTAEAADVLYHLLVMLAARDVTLADVEAELERREGTSGLAEKASR